MNAEVGYKVITLPIIANIAYQTGRKLTFDPENASLRRRRRGKPILGRTVPTTMEPVVAGQRALARSRPNVTPSSNTDNNAAPATPTTRREFVTRTATAAAGLGLAAAGLGAADRPARAAGQASPATPMKNSKIVLGLIGCGGMGSANMNNLMNHAEVEVAALCDVDEGRMAGDIANVEKKYGRKPATYKDYRKMLERRDINAVIIGTPDHWHALNLIHACEAGKDVYCEKPISHNIVEAKSMAGAARRYNRIVQVGTWQRSTREFTDAIAYVRSGKLGKITTVRAWKTDGARVGRHQPKPVPSTLDYDLWLGPAAKQPYVPEHTHGNWRWFSTPAAA
jgi:hypothetical protein